MGPETHLLAACARVHVNEWVSRFAGLNGASCPVHAHSLTYCFTHNDSQVPNSLYAYYVLKVLKGWLILGNS